MRTVTTNLLPHPIRRRDAPRLLLYVLASFGLTVVLIRLYLRLTGYPTIGAGGLHIAHLLWGGLALASAALLLLIYASPSIQGVAAILTGVGMGLFIDEVGKFITASNDYFFRPAAPIIYLCFLAISLLYYRLSRRRETALSESELICAALEEAEGLVERGSAASHRVEIRHLLRRVEQISVDPEHLALVMALRRFADHATARPQVSWWDQRLRRIEHALQARFNRHERAFTRMLMAVLALRAIAGTVAALLVLLALGLVAGGLKQFPDPAGRATWTEVGALLGILTNMLLLAGLVDFIFWHARRGLHWAQTALLLSLCVGQVFAFYTDQFGATIYAVLDALLLLFVRGYLRRKRAQAVQHLPGDISTPADGPPRGPPLPST